MKRKYYILAVLLCCSLLITGCSFSIKLNNKPEETTDQKMDFDTSDSNSNQTSDSNSNITSNTTDTSNTTNTGSKINLKCSKDFSNTMSNGVKMSQDVNIDFKDDKIEKMVMDMNFDLPNELASQASAYFNTLKNQYDTSYGKYNGVTVKVNKTSDMKFTISIIMDYTKVYSDDKTAMGFIGSESYSLNKTAFEKEGYKCN